MDRFALSALLIAWSAVSLGCGGAKAPMSSSAPQQTTEPARQPSLTQKSVVEESPSPAAPPIAAAPEPETQGASEQQSSPTIPATEAPQDPAEIAEADWEGHRMALVAAHLLKEQLQKAMSAPPDEATLAVIKPQLSLINIGAQGIENKVLQKYTTQVTGGVEQLAAAVQSRDKEAFERLLADVNAHEKKAKEFRRQHGRGAELDPAADPGPLELRRWTSADGKTTTEAEFAGISKGVVRLRKADGDEIKVPTDQLSEADRQWIRDRLQPK